LIKPLPCARVGSSKNEDRRRADQYDQSRRKRMLKLIDLEAILWSLTADTLGAQFNKYFGASRQGFDGSPQLR
jgi:hypothetical protein